MPDNVNSSSLSLVSTISSDAKYKWALNALDVLSSVRVFQDIANEADAKEKLYSAASEFIYRLIPIDNIVFLENNERDMKLNIVACEPEKNTEDITLLIDEVIKKINFTEIAKKNTIEKIILEEQDRIIILHPLVTPLGVKGLFLGVLGSKNTDINEIAINTVSVVIQNLSSSLDTYFSKQLTHNYNQHLEVVIKYRTRELEEAKKMAEVANVAKSDFLASMSHELNTPFNIIFGYLDLMMEDLEGITKEDPRFTMIDDLKKISFATKNLNKMVTNIIYLAKLEAGRIQIEDMKFHLKDMLSSLMQSHASMALERNNQSEMFFNSDYDVIDGDQRLLEKAIDNIMDNACKFTKNGSITINVQDENIDGKPYVSVEISDTGIGIADEDVKKLFSSFTQLDSGDSRSFEGLGLGLAITKRICSIIGAQLSVNSQLNEGSTFCIMLPVK